ncbi:hypothetical protein [Escherichia phage BI-EHEC]|nr:hypothetical protein [Escherichia phage BI-EHEC]
MTFNIRVWVTAVWIMFYANRCFHVLFSSLVATRDLLASLTWCMKSFFFIIPMDISSSSSG